MGKADEVRPRRRIEFSKIIIVCVAVAVVAVTVFACVLMWITMDTTALAYLIPSVFAELATATGFYYYKAKSENLLKLQKAGYRMPNEYGYGSGILNTSNDDGLGEEHDV